MELLSFFCWINGLFAIPATILFFGAGILLTFKTRFLQFRAFPHFILLIKEGLQGKKTECSHAFTMNPFHALFTAMGTTIGMGNVVGPSVAIIAGGPGALLWLLVYIFFGSITKFTEVTFAVATREKLADGYIIGGPMQYLRHVSSILAWWYVSIMTILFVGWSAIQSNTLAQIYAHESIPEWIIGLCLSLFAAVIIKGGAQRVGDWASKLVPLMCLFYIIFSLSILLQNIPALMAAIKSIFVHAFTPTAALGGFAGATVFSALRMGIFRAIFITEAGLGTASIPHALADTQKPTDQGILALFSMMSDAFLCTLSGLMTLVTGLWLDGQFRCTIIYEIFKMHSPAIGGCVLLFSITLFVLTTVIGNSFNGMQSFSSITRHRWVNVYILFTMLAIFFGSMIQAKLAWEIMDTFLMLVAIPNLIGILILSWRKPIKI